MRPFSYAEIHQELNNIENDALSIPNGINQASIREDYVRKYDPLLTRLERIEGELGLEFDPTAFRFGNNNKK
jgi:hypothetical protein